MQIKIAFLGMGGVGGFYGGKLAAYYQHSDSIRISFIARGEHLASIQKNGLKIILDNEEITAHPDIATNDPHKIGIVDYLIMSTKSYDLEKSIEQVMPCIGDKTVVLPLLNGGDITERIRRILPQNIIWSGCTYIVGRKVAPGVVQRMGELSRIVFGYDKGLNNQLLSFDAILKNAGIDSILSENIRENIWRKFLFISVSASLTSFFNIGFNDLVNTPEQLKETTKLANEFVKVAVAEGINMGERDIDSIIKRNEMLPEGSTSSMHTDFLNGHQTEFESLTGTIVKLAKKHNINVPFYTEIYQTLKANPYKK